MRELLASVAVAASVQGAPGDLPPAPTLIWRDPPAAGEAYVRGLTRAGTTVAVTVNGVAATGLRYGASRGGVASFAVPWPSGLPSGTYVVTAAASRGGLTGATSSPVYVVVPGVRQAPPRPA